MPNPIAIAAIGLFKGGGVDNSDTIPFGSGADTEVGILGGVERVPGAKIPQQLQVEMVAGAAKGNGEAEFVQAWQQVVEPVGVFQGEKFGDDVLSGIKIIERCLETQITSGRMLAEGNNCFFQLVRLRDIFGITAVS